MRVTVAMENRYTFFSAGFPYEDVLVEMRFHPPGYQYMPRFSQGWDGFIRLLKKDKQMERYYCGTGLFLALREKFEKKYGIEFDVHDLRVFPKFKLGAVTSDRGYQRECLDAMLAASNTGGIVLSATGTGKTWIAGTYFSRLDGTGCFIVDELQLLLQAQEELAQVMGEPVGHIGEMKFAPQRITVATVQTLNLHRHDPKFDRWQAKLDVLLIDELHVMLSKRSNDVVKEIHPKAVFGLTATLELEKKHVRLPAYDLCGPVIYTYPLDQAVEEGMLSDGIVVAAEFTNDKGKRRYFTAAAEYTAMISGNRSRNNFIEGLARAALKQGRSVIMMVERRQHVQAMHYRFHDIAHKLMYGGRKAKLRQADSKRFDAGEFPLIIASRVFKKGINIRSVNTIIDTAALRSSNDAKQKYGRGARLCEGKSGLLYIDICDMQRTEADWKGMRIRNRFARAAELRVKAFKKLKVKIVRAPETMKADDIISKAAKFLQKEKKQLAMDLK